VVIRIGQLCGLVAATPDVVEGACAMREGLTCLTLQQIRMTHIAYAISLRQGRPSGSRKSDGRGIAHLTV
jgi:hypothetical protein